MPTNLELELGIMESYTQMTFSQKCNFVADISNVVSHYIHNIDKIEYEVWIKDNDIREYIIAYYDGGAIAPRNANINSLSADFREIGRLLDGGYYDEVDAYKALAENGYTKAVYQVRKDDI